MWINRFISNKYKSKKTSLIRILNVSTSVYASQCESIIEVRARG